MKKGHLRKENLDKHIARTGNYVTQPHYRLKYRRKRGRCEDKKLNGSTY
jgi:hypothetical protein